MSPDQQIAELQKRVEMLEAGFMNLSQLDPQVRRSIEIIISDYVANTMAITDISDVDVTSLANGEILKYTTSGVDRWINAIDAT